MDQKNSIIVKGNKYKGDKIVVGGDRDIKYENWVKKLCNCVGKQKHIINPTYKFHIEPTNDKN